MRDLISRQAAIDALKEVMGLDENTEEERDGLAIARYIIKFKIPSAQPEQRWILCSERLPELDVPIVFTTALGTLNAGFRTDADTMNQFYSETCRCRRDNDDVIAWQPLPELYKESE